MFCPWFHLLHQRGCGTSMDLAYSDFSFLNNYSKWVSTQWILFHWMISAHGTKSGNQECLSLYWIITLITFKFIQELFILWLIFSNKNLKLLNLMPETVKTGVNDKKQKYCYWSIRTITMPKSFEGFHCLRTMIKHIIPGGWQAQIVGLDGFLENRNYFHLFCIWFCVETA